MSDNVQYPLARLDLYEEAVVLTRYESGSRRTSYPVAVDDVVAAFGRVPVASSLLPKNCLFWGRENGETQMAVYVPGRCWELQTAERTFHVPLPPLVFAGSGAPGVFGRYRVYAVKRRPIATPLELFQCPTPNVHPDGTNCQGNAPFPAVAGDTIEEALNLFLEGSLFNGDLAANKCRSFPDDVRQLWQQLEGAKRFPMKELVRSVTERPFALYWQCHFLARKVDLSQVTTGVLSETLLIQLLREPGKKAHPLQGWNELPHCDIIRTCVLVNRCRTMGFGKTVRRTYKYRLYHNRRNKRLHRCIDIVGLIWNHMVALQRRHYRLTGGYISRYRMQSHLAKLRRRVLRYRHWQLVGSQAVQELAERHDRAYQRFFAYQRGEGARHGRPRFKKVKRYASFTLKQAGWQYKGGNRVTIQGATYKFSFSRPVAGEIKTVTVKRDRVGHLWVCFSVVMEVDWPEPGEGSTDKSGGFDFGLKTFLTDHQGNAYRSPQYLKAELNEIARLNRELSRKQRGSHNRRKAKGRLAKAHARVANKRRDTHWKLAHTLCARFDLICLETLNLDGMKRLWGWKASDLGFGEFVDILHQVADKTGTRVVHVGGWEPTSQLCAGCGLRQVMPLSLRQFHCAHCGWSCHRDQNAALNILTAGMAATAAGASAAGLGDVRRSPVSAVSA